MTVSRHSIVRTLGRLVAAGVVLILLLLIVGAAAVQSSWGQAYIRRLIVSQADRYLLGALTIDEVDGSLFTGVILRGVRMTQRGMPVIDVERASVDYALRELYQGGTRIRGLRLEGLRVIAARDQEGHWNLTRLVRPRPPRTQTDRPSRTIALDRVELVDAQLEFRDPLTFGAARLPTRFEHLDAVFSVEVQSPAWKLSVDRASWTGHSPELSVTRFAGNIATDAHGWSFENLRVETARSAFHLRGGLVRQPSPAELDIELSAERFAFQEWGGVLTGLRNIAIESAITARLSGPFDRLQTTVDLTSNGGAVRGSFVLDSSVPGWHGKGTAEVARLDLSHWFNRPDRPSDITGRVDFDLDLELGRRFPRGAYAFTGSHAEYVGYKADDVTARGTLTASEAVIAAATATAYGANVRIRNGAITIDAPYRYYFAGRAAGLDLRRVPSTLPVPHVESLLTMGYSVRGQFAPGQLVGDVAFEASEFLGATIEAGATGSIDTTTTPVRFAGNGAIGAVSLRRFGEGLDIAWMRDPRYDGVLAGRFAVQGSGANAATMTLDATGRLAQAQLFQGTFHDADVSVHIEAGSLKGSYAGAFDHMNAARVADDARLVSSLSGTVQASFAIQDLLTREVNLADYTVDASATLTNSVVRSLTLDEMTIDARLANQTLQVTSVALQGPLVQARGNGTLELDDVRPSSFDFDVVRADVVLLSEAAGQPLAGLISSQGRLTGRWREPRVTGAARMSRITAGGLEVLTGAVDYDATASVERPEDVRARISGTIGPLTVGGQAINEISGSASLAGPQLSVDLRGTRAGGLNASMVSVMTVNRADRLVDLSQLTLQVQNVAWRLGSSSSPRLTWDDRGFSVRDLALTDVPSGEQRIAVSGEWRAAATTGLRLQATNVYLDPISGAMAQPPRYGGWLDADALVRPANGDAGVIVTGTFSVREGRIRRLSYDRLTATIGYDAAAFTVDARLDQRPGVWLTAKGTVPLGLLVEQQPDLPVDVHVVSSAIDLGIVEGLTDSVRDVSGVLQLDVTAVGTASDPHFEGTVNISNGAFAVGMSGARYRDARMAVALERDRVTVKALHVEDRDGHALDVTGSLATHELRVGDFAVTARARDFEVMRNEFGTTAVDADLDLRGQFESPRLTGAITITGGELNVDEILDRALLRPYATQAAAAPALPVAAPIAVDPLAVLNPWQRLGLDLEVRSRGTLRMVGDNVQVSSGTPIGLGNVNVRAYGDVYLYKDPGQPLFITGALDSLTGTYAFQGRRFDLDPTSSIIFRGELNPELYVTVRRTISAVETRVSIVGPLNEPELRLSSTPALDDSNILALIVFNTSLNELSSAQQQELAVRAGTLAAGFLATPLVTALERSLGLDILEIELQPGGAQGTTASPRVTVGDEIAPGLVARFSRQFGAQDYSEATIEYYLSRLFRIRATFSDAGLVQPNSRLRRVERAGIDLLMFFSF